MTEAPPLIGSAAAADILGITRRHFNRLVATHQIEPALTMGANTAARLFNRADVDALAARKAVAA